MAAPPIPPIQLELIATGLAVEMPHRPGLRRLAGSSVRRVAHSSSDATTYPTAFRGIGNGYRAEFADVANAPRFGLRPAGGVSQSVANVMVVQRTFDSARRAAELAPHPLSAASPAQGATGLPGRRISGSATFVA